MGVQFRLGRRLCAQCWTGTDRPGVLFDHACSWLIGHKVLLPGVSILERFVADVRSRMESRLSPFGYEHINMLGRYSFAVPDAVARGELRPLRTKNEQ